jgi:uncharacterized membrane protein
MVNGVQGRDLADHDAQRELEQHALANVRILVEVMQAREHARRRDEKRILIALGVIVGIVAVLIVFLLITGQGTSKGERRDLPVRTGPVDRPAAK